MVRLTAGQAGDNPQLVPLLDDYAAADTHHGMSGPDFGLLADKAYSHPSTRTEAADTGPRSGDKRTGQGCIRPGPPQQGSRGNFAD